MVCHGKGCNVTFSDVTFERRTLVATAGAKVTLTNCTFKRCVEGVSVLASGTNSTVNMYDNEIDINGGEHGVTVQAGASLDAKILHIKHLLRSSIDVRGALSTVEQEACTVTDVRSLLSDESETPITVCDGVTVRDSKHAKLTDVTIRDSHSRVVSINSASVSLFDFKVEQCHCGVRVIEQGSLADCVLSDSAFGLKVEGTCGVIQTRTCCHTRAGVDVSNGGCLVAKECVSVCSSPTCDHAAYIVRWGANLKIYKCDDTGHMRSCSIQQAGSFTAQELTVRDSRMIGLQLVSGGSYSSVQCRGSR